MSLPKVSIILGNGALGNLIASLDGVFTAIITGASEGTVVAGTPFTIYSLADLIALGITSASVTNTRLYKYVNEHYNELQDKGRLDILVVATTMTVLEAATAATAGGVSALLDYGKGDPRVVFLDIAPQAGPTVTNGINALTYSAATALQVTLNTYATAQKPMAGVVGADSFSGVAANLTNMKASTLNRVSIMIGDTLNTNVGATLGTLSGRLAKIPVQRKVSRVKDGALAITTAFIGTVAADSFSGTETIHDKGFITLRSFIGRNGFFFTSDPTCVADTDDYNTLSRRRVIDKAHRLAYATYINEVDDEVPVNTDGTIEAGYAKYLEQLITNQINEGMTANREISNFQATVPLDQNVVSTNKVKLIMKLQPVGYASTIEVTLGFAANLS